MRLAVVADVRLIAEAIALALHRLGDVSAVPAGRTDDDTADKVALHRPDVVVLHVSKRTTLSTIQAVRRRLPDARVAVVGLADPGEAVASAESGASGIIGAEASIASAASILERVGAGRAHFAPDLVAPLVDRLVALSGVNTSPFALLTLREHRILELITHGLSNKEIARALTIEVTTVKTHVHRLLKKLGVSSRGEAAAKFRAVSTTPR